MLYLISFINFRIGYVYFEVGSEYLAWLLVAQNLNEKAVLFYFIHFFLYPNSFDLINSKKCLRIWSCFSSTKKRMHFLEEKQEVQKELVIAIHGGGTLGYEWVYPLNQLNTERTRVAFFRWNPISATCAHDELIFEIIS